MISKPPECVGCPMFQDGLGFVPDELVAGAPVFILGQNPGEDEEREGRPYVGKTGQVMEREFFPRAGLVRGQVNIGNVLRCRWAKGKDKKGRLLKGNTLPPKKVLDAAMTHCMAAHYRPPVGVRLIVAQGALAWRALGQKTKITNWRGYLAPEN